MSDGIHQICENATLEEDSPFVKVFNIQVAGSLRNKEDNRTYRWSGIHSLGNIQMNVTFNFKNIWIQGYVVYLSESGDKITVDDGTDILYIVGLRKLLPILFIQESTIMTKGRHPCVSDCDFKGNYVGIMGQYVGDQVVYPLKIYHMDDVVLSECLWTAEVIEFQKYIQKTL